MNAKLSSIYYNYDYIFPLQYLTSYLAHFFYIFVNSYTIENKKMYEIILNIGDETSGMTRITFRTIDALNKKSYMKI